MHKFLLNIVTLVLLWTMGLELPGGPDKSKQDEEREVKGPEALMQELKNVPLKVYNIFKSAVTFHRRGDYDNAEKEYQKLRQIPSKDNKGFLDLHQESKVFRDNFDLLEKHKSNRDKGKRR